MRETINLESKNVILELSKRGAEILRIYDQHVDFELLWKVDEQFWNKTSPILFPVIGGFFKNSYCHNGKLFNMPKHGFARVSDFVVSSLTENSISFKLESNLNSKELYPFDFFLEIVYELNGSSLNIEYSINNCGLNTMYFHIGGHPAFNLKAFENSLIDDFYLFFPKDEVLERRYLINNLVSEDISFISLSQNRFYLDKSTFSNDALILANLKSEYVELCSLKSSRRIKVIFNEFPYLGIWSIPNSPFLCIEPWTGLPDSTALNTPSELFSKPDIVHLPVEGKWSRQWNISWR